MSDLQSEQRDGFYLGECWVAPGANEIGAVRVDAKAMDVLMVLAAAAPGVVSGATLLDRVWPKVVVGDNVVHQAIAHLRKVLGDEARAPRYIENIPRRGYRLIARIERAAPSPAAGSDITPSSASPTQHNLPAQLTSFVGRIRERAELSEVLAARRLVTLTGVGGAGKTRLALELAGGVGATFRDGVWLVELAPLADPALVVQAVATVLRIREIPGQSLRDTLFASVSSKNMLLVLDNCEHLIDECAHLVEALLQHAPDLKILATSREALGVAGEHPWRTLSLATPDPGQLLPLDELGEIESVRLFVERAHEVQPTFAVTAPNAHAVAQICRRLDGIPLAIELAAARVRALTAEQISSRLDDRFRLLTGGSRTALPRQQTLQATLDWSYALLEEPEQVLFRRLAVFAGGWTLEAAEAVAGAPPLEAWQTIDLLTRLMDKSWLQVASIGGGAVRYRLLETVRQYSKERLVEAGEGEIVRDRHRDFFVQMADQTTRELQTGDQLAALASFDVEHDNLQLALAWCLDGDEAIGLRLVSSLWRYWLMRGRATAGRRWLEDFIARVPQTAETAPSRASALLGAGWLARFQGDSTAAGRQLEQSVAIYRTITDRGGEAEALSNLASNLIYMGEADAGERIAATALELARVAGDPRVIGYCLQTFGDHLASRGDFARARPLLDEGVGVLRVVGHKPNLAFALAKLGNLLSRQGEFVPARAALEEALTLHQLIGEGLGIDHTLIRLGWLAHHEGDDAQAEQLLERSLPIAEEAGFVPEVAAVLALLGRLLWRRGETERGAKLLRLGLQRSQQVQAHDPCASCLEGLAVVAAGQQEPVRAVRLLGAASRIRETAVRPLPPVERREYDALLRTLRTALGKADFTATWATGQAMTQEQAVAEALEELPSALRGTK